MLPEPHEDDDINHDGKHPQTSAAVSTTILDHLPPALSTAVPTDVGGNRPVPPKLLPNTTSTSQEGTAQPSQSSSAASATQAEWLSWLPTFGFGPKTTAWTYGALGLIIAFCGGLSIYFWWARRKAKIDDRQGYEFDVMRDEEEGQGLNGAGKGKRRAGELYDAFATGSDDDLDYFASDSDEDEDEIEQAYRDRSNEDVGAGGVAGALESKESLDRESDEGNDEDDKPKRRQISG